MAEVLEPLPVTQAELVEWFQMKEALSALKAKEMLLRSRIYKYYFKDPKEGTNNLPLEDGTGAVIKGTRTIDRKVDEGQLQAMMQAQHAAIEANKAGAAMPLEMPVLDYAKLIKWKPELAIREYRTLTDNERHFFDQCLIIKDGSPALEITIPKRVTT